MAEILNIGVSALLSTQRVLATVGHNISNVNTPGYTRQRVELSARDPQLLAGSFYGKGVDIRAVTRLSDMFLNEQVRISTTNFSQVDSFHDLAAQLSNMLADAESGMSPAMSEFFNSLQQLSDQPASIPIRQSLLGAADTLVDRFHDQIARIDDINTAINTRIEEQIARINELAQSIADINRDIVLTTGRAGPDAANDLLDRRDQLIVDLSKLTGVRTLLQDDGAINVSIGNGISLVTGSTTASLTSQVNALDASRTEVGYTVGGITSIVTDQLPTGELGGTISFREDMLEPTRNGLGRLAAVLAQTFNAQHREGMDMNGALGGNFFTIPAPSFSAASTNTGSITVAFDANNVGNLTNADYDLTYNGVNWQLYNISTNTTQTLAGAGPFTVDGLTITLGAAPAAGDSYRLQPTRYVARDISLNVSSVRQIAAAAPVRSRAALGNVGAVTVSAPEILDATNASLTTTTTLVFDNPPSTYKVNGVGASIAYTAGANIDINGWRVQMHGTPAAGDQVVIEANSGGIGDNTNSRLLAALQTARFLDGGTASYQDGYGAIVGDVGSRTRQSEVSSSALKTLLENAVNSQQQLSGVNLDEEAADLMRFQQAYNAAAQVIATANELFDELINAVRG